MIIGEVENDFFSLHVFENGVCYLYVHEDDMMVFVPLYKFQNRANLPFIFMKIFFWNLFEKELPKYKDKLDAIFILLPLLEAVNVNTTSNHIFSHLHNYHIVATYVMDPKSILTLAPP